MPHMDPGSTIIIASITSTVQIRPCLATPLIPSTMPEDAVIISDKQVPMKRPGQPAELATAYVMLADLASYVSGATIAVTGGKPIL